MDLGSQQQRGWMDKDPKPQHPQDRRGGLGYAEDRPCNWGFWGSRMYLGLHNSNTVVSGFETALEIEEGNKSLLHSLTRGVTLPIPPASES